MNDTMGGFVLFFCLFGAFGAGFLTGITLGVKLVSRDIIALKKLMKEEK